MKTVTGHNQAKIQKEKDLAVLMQKGTETQKQNAFNVLYKEHVAPLTYEVMKKYKMDKEIARDLTQEIFMKVFLNINSYETTYAFSTWLYKIAHNHIIDNKRKQNFEVLNYEVLQVNNSDSSEDSGAGAMVFQLEDKSANNHELLVRKERADMIHDAITSIKNEDTKRIVKSFFIEDKSHEDICKETQLPLGTVKALIFRAKETMRNYMSVKYPEFEYGNVCKIKLKTVREVERSEG